MLKQTIYNSRDNEIVLALYIDGVEFPANTITRVVLKLKNDDGGIVTVDSSSTIRNGAFTFTDKAAVLDDVMQVIKMRLGMEVIPVREDYIGTLIVYTPSNPAGVVWDDTIAIAVRS